jgi:hypothetical protein
VLRGKERALMRDIAASGKKLRLSNINRTQSHSGRFSKVISCNAGKSLGLQMIYTQKSLDVVEVVSLNKIEVSDLNEATSHARRSEPQLILRSFEYIVLSRRKGIWGCDSDNPSQ